MKRSPTIMVLAALIILATAGAASAVPSTCGLSATCNSEDLGGGRYRLTYVLANVSTGTDVIFKWRIASPGVSSKWTAVQFDGPTGWSGSFGGGHLDFDTPNGSGRTERLYSPSAKAACGGLSTLTFSWTVDRNDGPVPGCGTLTGDDFTVHTQAIDAGTCDNVGTSYVCTNVVPVEPISWGAIKARYRD